MSRLVRCCDVVIAISCSVDVPWLLVSERLATCNVVCPAATTAEAMMQSRMPTNNQLLQTRQLWCFCSAAYCYLVV